MKAAARIVLWLAAAVAAYAVCAVIVLAAAACSQGTASGPDRGAVSTPAESGWEVTSFSAKYDIDAQGVLQATEQVDVDFHSLDRHGIYRDLFWRVDCAIPRQPAAATDLSCRPGELRTYDISVSAVTSADGRAWPYTVSRVGDTERVTIGDPLALVSGKQSYIIRYLVRGSLDAYGDHDELYWNASGRWATRISSFSSTVTIPTGTIAEARCFQGTPATTLPCQAASTPGGAAVFRTTGGLNQGEQMTLLATFAKEIVAVPAARTWHQPSFRDFYRLDAVEVGGSVLVGLLVAAALAALWWEAGRDRQYKTLFYLTEDPSEGRRPLFGGPPIVVEFTPPGDLRPAEMGFLLDERPDALDVTATIVDLAVRGYLRIDEVDAPGSFPHGKDWRLTRLKEPDKSLLAYERTLLDALFSDGFFSDDNAGKPVRLSELRRHFLWRMFNVRDRLYKDAAARKWFARDPREAKKGWAGKAFLVTVLGLALCYGAGWLFGRALLLNALPLGGLALVPLAHTMPRRTATGSEALRRVLGFRLYIDTAEARREAFNEQASIFTRYLPYAIVFGSVTKWAKAFRGLDDEIGHSIDWYSGTGVSNAFAVTAFSSALSGMALGVHETVTSAPVSAGYGGSSSTGGLGGFGGGGFGGGGGVAGGGGGGGGGGSW